MQVPSEFLRLNDWEDIAKKVVDKYPERYGHIDVSKIVAYVITNKEQSDAARPYEMMTDKLPMRLTNNFDYFVWFRHPAYWSEKPRNIQVALVISALERINPDNPYSILPLDYRDQNTMVHTFGASWFGNCTIPDALENDINWKQ